MANVEIPLRPIFYQLHFAAVCCFHQTIWFYDWWIIYYKYLQFKTSTTTLLNCSPTVWLLAVWLYCIPTVQILLLLTGLLTPYYWPFCILFDLLFCSIASQLCRFTATACPTYSILLNNHQLPTANNFILHLLTFSQTRLPPTPISRQPNFLWFDLQSLSFSLFFFLPFLLTYSSP